MTTKRRLNQLINFQCQFCGADNEVECDPDGKSHFTLTEDCYVCCRPNLLRVTFEEESGDLSAEVDQEA